MPRADDSINTTKSAADHLNLKKFFLEQSGGSLEHSPWNDKKIKNSEQFQKCTQKAQKGHG
jgi:hypothetical protein